MPISSNVLQEQATSLLINHTLFYIFYYFSMTKCQYSLRTPASCICTIIRSHIYIHTLPIGIYMTHPYTIYLVVARSVMCENKLTSNWSIITINFKFFYQLFFTTKSDLEKSEQVFHWVEMGLQSLIITVTTLCWPHTFGQSLSSID